MNDSSDQFQAHQPRTAVRQRSHSTKELASMLQQFQLSLQLMPLNDQSTSKQAMASTSEDESESNENSSTSEDEAFCDEDYEFDSSLCRLKNTQQPKSLRQHQFINNNFTTGLIYPGRLRRSSSLGQLNKQRDDEHYFSDYMDDDAEINYLNDSQMSVSGARKSSFRSTLPRARQRFTSSLKELNKYTNSGDSLQSFQFNKNSYFEARSSVKTNPLPDEMIEFQPKESSFPFVFRATSDRTQLKQTIDSQQQKFKSSMVGNQSIYCLTNKRTKRGSSLRNSIGVSIGSTNIRHESSVCSTNRVTSGKQTTSSNQVPVTIESIDVNVGEGERMQKNEFGAATSRQQPAMNGGACLSVYQHSADSGTDEMVVSSEEAVSEDINNEVNFKSSVSCFERSAQYSNKFSQFNNDCKSNQQPHQTVVLSNSSISSIIEQPAACVSYSFSDPHCLNSESTDLTSSCSVAASVVKRQQFSDSKYHSATTTNLSTEPLFSDQVNVNGVVRHNLSNDRNRLDDNTEFEYCDELIDLKNVLLSQAPLLRSIEQRRTTSNKLISTPELPVLEEETNSQISGECDPTTVFNMQTLAETQYNQLSYHISALSCVCDNKSTNLTNYAPFTSSPNNQSSSVDSSPNSSEYSSPYSSPPSSPSSISSYSSAEEDCTILTKFSSSPKNSSSSTNTNTSICSNSQNNNSPLAQLITADHNQSECSKEVDIDVVDCATVYNRHHQTLLTTAAKLNDLNNSDNKDVMSNDGSQLDNETTKIDNKSQINETNNRSINYSMNTQNTNKQTRVRKTSILRNHSDDLVNCSKKEVKFADTLGFALEKIQYFPNSPQVKPKRHSVNLASLHRDYYDEHQELFILHSRPQTKDNQTLAKQFEERSALYSKQQSKLNLETNIFNSSQSKRGTYSPPNQSSNNFWASSYQSFGSIRDAYCGDMFHHQNFDSALSTNSQPTVTNLSTQINTANAVSNVQTNHMNNYSQMVSFKPTSGLGLNFMNNQMSALSNNFQQEGVSFLPLNFGQPYIQSDFPNRLRTQSILLHSLDVVDVVGNTVNGIISVMNLTFEKRVIVKYTLNKWATEKQCEARYSKKDCDNSDRFVFQITLKENDFPQFQLNEDRTTMFAIRYETGDGRVYWDNNYVQDYRLKCKFN